MTKVLLITVQLISMMAFAGGAGGGGVMSRVGQNVTIGIGTGVVQNEWVRYVRQDQNEVVFEYGQQNEKNELYTQTFKQRPEEFEAQQLQILQALDRSKETKDWNKVQTSLER